MRVTNNELIKVIVLLVTSGIGGAGAGYSTSYLSKDENTTQLTHINTQFESIHHQMDTLNGEVKQLGREVSELNGLIKGFHERQLRQ